MKPEDLAQPCRVCGAPAMVWSWPTGWLPG